MKKANEVKHSNPIVTPLTIIQYLSVNPRNWTMRTIVSRIAHVQYDLRVIDVRLSAQAEN